MTLVVRIFLPNY